MSGASGALIEAAVAALRQVDGLTGVYEAGPVQAAGCHATVEVGLESDWGHKGGAGRELRLSATIKAPGEGAERLRAIAAEAEAALAALGPDLAQWRVVTLQFLRSRTLRDVRSGWATVIEFRARMLAL